MNPLVANPYLENPFVVAHRYVNPCAGIVIFNNQECHIRRKELEILALLCAAKGDVVTRETFISTLWQDNLLLGNPGLTRAIGDLRKTIQDSDKSSPLITTLPRKGYCLNAVAQIVDDDAPSVPLVDKDNWVGAYRLVEQIRKVDAARVYLAEQNQPIQREVVVKVVANELANKGNLARFESERMALSMMCHPNIVSICDGGETGAGEPYTVFEYCQGKNIVAYSGEQQLTLVDRIALFLQACDGMQHAHHKGIVHRGLKPSCILVTGIADSQPVVKIIDFDNAKSLYSFIPNNLATSDEACALADTGYASPEQLLQDSAEIDTRTDIYALGMLLYELVLGDAPHVQGITSSATGSSADGSIAPGSIVDGSIAEVGQRLPLLANGVSALSKQQLALTSANRQLSQRQYKKIATSDITWIIKKCVAADKNQRYASVTELREDLLRYIQRQPVLARGQSRGYQLGKFVERNRFSTLVISVLLVGFIAASTLALHSYRQAVDAHQQAQTSIDEASKATAFISQRLKTLSPLNMGYELRNDLLSSLEEGGHEATADHLIKSHYRLLSTVNFTDLLLKQLDRHLIQPALQDITQEFSGYPALQATLYQDFASVLNELGLHEKAREPQQLALAIRRQHLGSNHPLTLAAMRQKGLMNIALNDLGQSIQDLTLALEGFRQQLGLDHPETLHTQNRLAVAYYHDGQYQRSLSILQDVLVRQRSVLGDHHVDTQKTNNNIGNVYYQLGMNQQARRKYQESYQFRKQILGEDHPQTLTSISNLIKLDFQMGNTAETVTQYQDLVAKRREVHGVHHRRTLYAQNFLTEALINEQRLAEALDLARQTLETAVDFYGESNREALKAKHNLAWIQKELGNLARAKLIISDVVQKKVTSYGNDHPLTQKSIALRDSILRETSSG